MYHFPVKQAGLCEARTHTHTHTHTHAHTHTHTKSVDLSLLMETDIMGLDVESGYKPVRKAH